MNWVNDVQQRTDAFQTIDVLRTVIVCLVMQHAAMILCVIRFTHAARIQNVLSVNTARFMMDVPPSIIVLQTTIANQGKYAERNFCVK